MQSLATYVRTSQQNCMVLLSGLEQFGLFKFMPRYRSTFNQGLPAMGKTKKSFYAVRTGRKTGVYTSWDQCQAQVNGYSGAVFKGFSTRAEAEQFASQSSKCSPSVRSTYSGDFTSHRSRSGYSSGVPGYSASSTRLSQSGYSYSRKQRPGSSTSHYYSSSSSSIVSSRPVVYSDGSCFKNGYKGASGGVGVYWGEGNPHNVSEKLDGHQTNQRAELVSACRALETAIDQGYRDVELKTDSTYTIKSITEWIPKWKKNGWKTVNSEPVKNKADIQRLDSLCQQVNVKWTHVPSHKGVHGNEAADQLAKAGSQK